ncbi:hypothetical protein [Anabaena azotica]|uniref:HMA domain-containing protein n=1 Tax=Anabaena azotica FACHB-119 TaxID=947527 RepID=A0ABR8D216_9NOST|nr:hypothetical protein [Anabaena azotica]MBD2500300.1 hypothetical protein [Anabaena azotica FACHB-119]
MEDSASSSDAVPRPSPNSYTNPEKIFSSIIYALPGQITYCIPRISEDANYRQRLLRLLEAQTGISYKDVNAATGSLVVAYESRLMSSTEIRKHLASLFETANLTDDTDVTSVPSTAKSVILPSAPESIIDKPATEPAPKSIIDKPATEPAPKSIIDAPATEPAPKSIIDAPATEPAPKSIIDAPATEPAPKSIIDKPTTEPASESITDKPATEPASESIIDKPTTEPAPKSIIDKPATEPASESITDKPATEPAPKSIIDKPATKPASESITDKPATEPAPKSIIDKPATKPASESIIDAPATEPAIKVEYSVVHSIPGRVRFYVPQIATDPAYVQRLQALLQSDPIVTSERINREAASVIITYKPGKVPKPKDELQSIFAIAVAHFSSLIQSAGITSNKSSSR